MSDNFLPRARDQRSLLPPAWEDRVLEGDLAWFILDAVAQRGVQRMNFGCPTGLNTGLSNRLGNAFIPYRTQSTLTCRCQMGDNYNKDVCSLPRGRKLPSFIIVTPALQMDHRFNDICIL